MVTGRGSLFLTDAVAAHKKLSVCLHHEQSAVCTVSYTEHNEKIGGCLVSTGCASTNALTGVQMLARRYTVHFYIWTK